ncbi:MAG: hypothetical protein HYR80_00230, partial [Nitrospirae bacterium]|nr:hypothetical protein [Nitrospirota bacterium]
MNRDRSIKRETYADGSIKSETEWKKDRKDGLLRTYFETGELKSELRFKNGILEGMAKG